MVVVVVVMLLLLVVMLFRKAVSLGRCFLFSFLALFVRSRYIIVEGDDCARKCA